MGEALSDEESSAAGARGGLLSRDLARGRTTKIHALTDGLGRPLSFIITPHDLDGALCAVGHEPLAPLQSQSSARANDDHERTG